MNLSIIEGNSMWLDGGGMYGHVPKNMWEKWTPPDAQNRIHIACRCLLLQTDDGRNILFETGTGDFFEPKFKERYGITGENQLLVNLPIKPSEVDAVVLSHLHFDHAGGLLSGSKLAFPKAKFYIGKEHWERAQKPHLRERASFIPALHTLLAESGRLVLVEGKSHPDLDFGLTFTYSYGHTVGLMLSHLDLPTGLLCYASDLVLGMPWIHLPITTGYDRYAELVVDEKRQLLEMLADQKGRILFTHDLATPCALISRDAHGKFVGEKSDLIATY